MKLKATIPLLAGLLLLVSCSNDEPIAPQQTEKTAATLSFDRELSADDAVAIAREAVMRLKYGDAAESRSATSLTPSQVRRYPAVSRSATTPGTYIVNFDEGGYAVVVADTADPQVLALNDEGTFDPDTQPGNAYFMTLADDYLSFTFDSINATPKLPGEGGETPVNPNPDSYLSYIMHNGHRCHLDITYEKTDVVKTLLKTTWHQNEPYNKFYPTYKDDKFNITLHRSAGCMVIALVQIMAYQKKPEIWNNKELHWTEYTSRTDISLMGSYGDELAEFIYNFGLACNMSYNENGTGVSVPNAVAALKKYGFTSSVLVSGYDDAMIVENLLSGNPVALIAFRTVELGHAWVVDGSYRIIETREWTDIDNNVSCHYDTDVEQLYLHCNWGWANYSLRNDERYTKYEGYYYSGVFSPVVGNTQYEYNQKYQMICNIY